MKHKVLQNCNKQHDESAAYWKKNRKYYSLVTLRKITIKNIRFTIQYFWYKHNCLTDICTRWTQNSNWENVSGTELALAQWPNLILLIMPEQTLKNTQDSALWECTNFEIITGWKSWLIISYEGQLKESEKLKIQYNSR